MKIIILFNFMRYIAFDILYPLNPKLQAKKKGHKGLD